MQSKLYGVLAGAGDNYHEKAEKIYRLLQELEYRVSGPVLPTNR